MARNYSSIAEPKTLTANVSSVATQITLNNVTGLPSPPYVLVINPDTNLEEVILVDSDQSGVTSPTLKVTRAIESGATAKTHTSTNIVKHMIVGSDLQLVHSHLDNTTTAHGATGAVVGTTNTQTLTGKTLTSPKINENVTLTATATELNVLDGITASTAELNHTDGVTSAIQTQLNTLTSSIASLITVPSGVISPYAGLDNNIPAGYFLCNGQAISRTTYATLFGVVGVTYGAGDTTTTFNVPNLKGRVPVGFDATQTEFDLLGDTGGAKTHALTQSEMPRHNHGINPSMIVGTGTNSTAAYAGLGNQNQQAVTTFFTGGSGNTESASDGVAHPNLQPYIVVNYIIKH